VKTVKLNSGFVVLALACRCLAAGPEYLDRRVFEDHQRLYWENEAFNNFNFLLLGAAIILFFGFSLMYAAIITAYLLRDDYPTRRKPNDRGT
jgi:hypothetical protein